MCDICVMNAVKDKMLSRRSFFKSAAVGAAAAAVGSSMTGTAAMADGHSSVLDMTHELHPDFPTYFGESGFQMESKFNFAEHHFNLNLLSINEHTGTHVDTPLHFSADGKSVAEIPVENLIAPLCVIDIAARAADDVNAQVTPDDIKKVYPKLKFDGTDLIINNPSEVVKILFGPETRPANVDTAEEIIDLGRFETGANANKCSR